MGRNRPDKLSRGIIRYVAAAAAIASVSEVMKMVDPEVLADADLDDQASSTTSCGLERGDTSPDLAPPGEFGDLQRTKTY